jgi:hypothetical protein
VRSGGREGSAIGDDLIAFAKERRWRRASLALAHEQATRAEADYREFAEAEKNRPANS